MVFYSWVVALRPRNHAKTTEILKELAVNVYTGGGVIRKLSNEGIMKPYKAFRDTSGATHMYVRYIHLQIDVSEDEKTKLLKRLQDHPDVVRQQVALAERPRGISSHTGFFPLDGFSRMEEETVWPPQAGSDVYEHLDANWKEFSRTRWSNFLRS